MQQREEGGIGEQKDYTLKDNGYIQLANKEIDLCLARDCYLTNHGSTLDISKNKGKGGKYSLL